MMRNLCLAILAVFGFAWPAAAGANTPEQPDVPLVTPVVAALATLAPEVADWPNPDGPPGSALRGTVNPRDKPTWVMTIMDICATERLVTVELYTSLQADITIRVHDDKRTLARTRVRQQIGERTVTLTPELRRRRTYRVEVVAQRPDEKPIKEPRPLIVRSACR